MWSPDMWQAIQAYRNGEPESLEPSCEPSKRRWHKRADTDHEREGLRFGRLTIVKYVYSVRHGRVYECVCDCGNYVDVVWWRLKSGNIKSCGCLRRDHGVSQCELMNQRRHGR